MSAQTIHHRHISRGLTGPFARLVRSNFGVLASAVLLAYVLRSSMHGGQSKAAEVAGGRGGKAEVLIDHHSFSPNSVTVPVGATVTWTNRDNDPHTVTSSEGEFKKSPILKEGQTFSNTFTNAGTFSYACSIHPQMTGKIIVK